MASNEDLEAQQTESLINTTEQAEEVFQPIPEPDPNNPPLRRMRTSLVNRRRMAMMQEQEVCSKYLQQHVKDFFYQGCLVLYFIILFYLPDIFGGSRDPECTMKTALANLLFGYIIVGGQCFVHFCFIVGYAWKSQTENTTVLKEYVEKAAIVTVFAAFIFNGLGAAIYFYWTQVLWTDIDSGDCTSGYNLLDFVNWLIILIMCLAPAILGALGVCCGICCAPCIYQAITEYYRQQREEEQKTEGLLSAVVRRQYNPQDFKQNTDCAICMCPFEETDEVTPLPCNTGHYFHSACITPWLETNNTCPMCRKEINATDFEELQRNLDATQ